MTSFADETIPGTDTAALAGRYLTFVLSRERYGVAITKVSEIIGMMHVTPVPNSTAALKGIINLRGKIIPVVSLRLQFGLREIPHTRTSCIVIMEVAGAEHVNSIGIIVDSVEEVIALGKDQIEEPPRCGEDPHARAILALGKSAEGQVVFLLDADKSFAPATS